MKDKTGVVQRQLEVEGGNAVCVLFDDGTTGYLYNRELQVLELPVSAVVINGSVTIGDTVAWPQRTGSYMWMAIGVITDIVTEITDVTHTDSVTISLNETTEEFRINEKVTKITIVTPEGTKKSTTVLHRVVKAWATTTS
jgi:hypothetical protein